MAGLIYSKYNVFLKIPQKSNRSILSTQRVCESLTEKTDFLDCGAGRLPDRIFSFFLHIWYGCTALTSSKTAFLAFEQYFRKLGKNIYTQYDNFVSIFIENSCWKMWDFVAFWSHFYLNNFYMVILHTETCKKKEKLEKNYLHLYLTKFLNIILMLTSERLAEYAYYTWYALYVISKYLRYRLK